MFQFVVLSHPDDIKGRALQGMIRQHSIRRGIRSSKAARARNQKEGAEATSASSTRPARTSDMFCADIIRTPSISLMDPFDTLCASSTRLHSLLKHPLAKQAGEPIFRVEGTGRIFFQGSRAFYEGALTDASFFHALSLVLALATNNNRSNQETLTHHGELLKNLSTAIRNNDSTPSASTITAILILIGCEYRAQGARSTVIATHIRGLQAMINNMQHQNERLIGQVRRALFWQDLISSLVTASPRLLCLEKHYSGARLSDLCVLPSGFSPIIGFWSAKFVGVLEDLNALCLLVDMKYSAKHAPRQGLPDVVLMAELDDEGYPTANSQADIESRVVDLLSESRCVQSLNDLIYQACLFAAYLCTYRLSAGVWEGHFVAERCVAGILDSVASSTYDIRWILFPELLLWLLFVSGGLTEDDRNRERSVAFIQHFCYESTTACWDWKMLIGKLSNFIWCQHAMEWRIHRVWSEVHQRTEDLSAS